MPNCLVAMLLAVLEASKRSLISCKTYVSNFNGFNLTGEADFNASLKTKFHNELVIGRIA
jgi:hypothetical protein